MLYQPQYLYKINFLREKHLIRSNYYEALLTRNDAGKHCAEKRRLKPWMYVA